jgi:hypothetical protein
MFESLYIMDETIKTESILEMRSPTVEHQVPMVEQQIPMVEAQQTITEQLVQAIG